MLFRRTLKGPNCFGFACGSRLAALPHIPPSGKQVYLQGLLVRELGAGEAQRVFLRLILLRIPTEPKLENPEKPRIETRGHLTACR